MVENAITQAIDSAQYSITDGAKSLKNLTKFMIASFGIDGLSDISSLYIWEGSSESPLEVNIHLKEECKASKLVHTLAHRGFGSTRR